MSKAFMLALTVMCEDHALVLKAAEAITRTQIGLALEGMSATLSVSTVEYEESESEA